MDEGRGEGAATVDERETATRQCALSLSLLYLSAAHSAAVADVQPAPGITPATTRTAGEGGVGDAAPAGAPRFLRDGMLLSHRRRTTLARSRLRRRLDPVVSAQVWGDTRWRGSVRGAASHRVWEERHRVFWRDGKERKRKTASRRAAADFAPSIPSIHTSPSPTPHHTSKKKAAGAPGHTPHTPHTPPRLRR
jgi:hypothetical protein